MSTLTPIVTQLELDRDRFNELVNGDVNDTVELESRTEKSIAGQVADRIDALGFDLSQAVIDAQAAQTAAEAAQTAAETAETNAETAESGAFNAQTAAEGARDLTLTYRDDAEFYHGEIVSMYGDVLNAASSVSGVETAVTNLRDEAEVFRNEAITAAANAATSEANASTFADNSEGFSLQSQQYRDQAQAIADSISAGDLQVVKTPTLLTPTANLILDETAVIPLVAGSPIILSDNVEFVDRTFLIEVYNTGLDTWDSFYSQTETKFSHELPAMTLDGTSAYRWKVTDRVRVIDTAGEYFSSQSSEYVELFFEQDAQSPTRVNPVFPDTPTVSMEETSDISLTPTFNGDAFNASSGTHVASRWVVTDTYNGEVVYSLRSAVDLESTTVPVGFLQGGREYNVSVMYEGSEEASFSEWSDPITFTTADVIADSQADIISIKNNQNGFSPTAIYPNEHVILSDSGADIDFVGSVPIATSPSISKFIGRTVVVEEYTGGAWSEVGFNLPEGLVFSVFLAANNFSAAGTYRWKVVDRYENRAQHDFEGTDANVFTVESEYVDLIFASGGAEDYDYDRITAPTISIDTNEANLLDLSVSGFASDSTTATEEGTVWVIVEESTGKIDHVEVDVGSAGITVEKGQLKVNADYRVYAKYIGNTAAVEDEYLHSDWSSDTFSTDDYVNSPERITSSNDPAAISFRAANVHQITSSGTTGSHTAMTIDEPAPSVSAVMYFRIESADTTFPWPANVVFSGGTSPTLGTDFSVVKLVWTGIEWAATHEVSVDV